MSQLTIAGNASGTGIFTVAAPNSNTNRTLTLPDAAGTVALTANIPGEISEANIQNATSSTTGLITGRRFRAALNAGGTAPIYACRAWVNFNGTDAVRRGNGNVSSVTRLAVGQYTVTFATAMQDANYSVSGAGRAGGTTAALPVFGIISAADTITASSVRVGYRDINGVYADGDVMCVAIFR